MSRLLASAAVVALIVSTSRFTGLAQSDAIPADLVIRLERTACYGVCPVYSVTLDAQGNVTFESTNAERALVRRTDRIPAANIVALLATARRIGFFDLRDSYRAPISDLPTTYVTITANGRTKKIEDYFGAPRELKQLEIQIDEAARTQRWIRDAQRAPEK